jgi:hypothetical protein
MRGTIRATTAGWIFLGLCVSGALGQTVERDTVVTGPRGRSVERDVRIQRGPGSVDRQVTIRRPGGTFTRDTRVQRFPGMVGPGGGRFVERDFFVGGPPVVVQRNFFVPAAPTVGIGLPFFNFFVGSPLPPPPPVVVTAPPVVAAPGMPAAPAQSAPPVAGYDAFADAYGRLGSMHSNSRRDGALTLGRLRDPRAVTALVQLVEHDTDKKVRMAAAWSLGEIGDPRAALPLEKVSLYDKKQDVRDIAASAYRRLPREGEVVQTEPPKVRSGNAPSVVNSTTSDGLTPPRTENVPPPPQPEPGFPDQPKS